MQVLLVIMGVKLFTFCFINFIVGYVSDITLNDLSKNGIHIGTLKKYFDNKSINQAAIYAGLTVVVGIVMTSLVTKYMMNFAVPTSLNQLIKYSLVGFLVGYVLDILIEKTNIFPNLDEFFSKYGAGLWGGLSIVFSIVLSYVLQQHFLPILK